MTPHWLERLGRWIKAFARWQRKATPKDSRIIQTWKSPWGILHLVKRATPEAVENAAYQFLPAYERQGTHLLLTCDRFKPIRNAGGGDCSPNREGLRNGTLVRGHPLATHRISLSVVAEVPGTNLVRDKIIFSYPVDFVGLLGYLKSDRDDFAQQITKILAQRLLKQSYRKIHWEQTIHELAAPIGSSHEILMEGDAA